MFKKNSKLLLIILMFLFLAYGYFFKFHLVSDAYRIIDSSDAFMIVLKCNEGRLVQVLYFLILNLFNFSINSISMYMFSYRINTFLSIAFLAACILITYKMLIMNIKNINTRKKIVIFICTLFMFINISICEYLLYFENFIMIFGLLLSVVSAYIYNKNIKLKYAIIPILILISSFCYQGVAQIFVILSALVVFTRYSEQKQSYYLKELFKILLLYLLPLSINYLVCWYLNSILPNIDPRLFTGIGESLKNLLSPIYTLVPIIYMLILGFIILFNLKLFAAQNSKEILLKISYLMIISLISFIIFVFNNSVRLQPRTMLNFIIIYPVLKIYISSLKIDDKFSTDIIVTLFLLIINIILILSLQISNIYSTKQNITVALSIVEKIEKYETENNIKVENVAFCGDSELNYEYWNCKNALYFTYTAPIFYDYWCDIYSLNVLCNRKFNKVPYTKISESNNEIYEYFLSQNWDEPNINEQVLFDGNTVYICCF